MAETTGTSGANEALYSIRTVAAAFDLPVSTLRYYDESGLVMMYCCPIDD